MLLGGWLAGKPLLTDLAMAFGLSLAPFLLLLGLMEVFFFINHPTKQVFQFEKDKIVLGTFKNAPVVDWNNMLKFQFEPIVTELGMTQLIVSRSKLWKGKKRIERRVLVIENPVQTRELLAYLQKQKSEASAQFEIAVFNKPSPLFEMRPHVIAAMTLTLGGFFVFIQGVGILLGLVPHGHNNIGGNSRFSPEQIAKIQTFWHQYFSNYTEFRNIFLTLGICLVVAGVGLMVLGKRLGKNPSQIQNHP
jgi:hypothetical protein